MKRTQLFALAALVLGLQGFAQASPFPADAEASYNLPAVETYADRHAADANAEASQPMLLAQVAIDD